MNKYELLHYQMTLLEEESNNLAHARKILLIQMNFFIREHSIKMAKKRNLQIINRFKKKWCFL